MYKAYANDFMTDSSSLTTEQKQVLDYLFRVAEPIGQKTVNFALKEAAVGHIIDPRKVPPNRISKVALVKSLAELALLEGDMLKNLKEEVELHLTDDAYCYISELQRVSEISEGKRF